MRFFRILGIPVLAVAVVTAWAGVCPADPCGLITREEARIILGEEVTAPQSRLIQGMAAGRSCVYRTAAPISKRGGIGSLKIIVYDPQTMEEKGIVFKSPRKYFEKYFKTVNKKVVRIDDIPHLGDKAKWSHSSHTLHVLAGDIYFQVIVKDLTKMSAKSKAELERKLSKHRLGLALKVAKDYILPRLKAK